MYAVCIFIAVFAVTGAKEEPIKRPVDCDSVRCAWPRCGEGFHAVTLEENCCPTCEECPPRLLPCPLLVCESITYSDREPCGCPVCALVTKETDSPPTTVNTELPKTTVITELPTPIVDPPVCEISGQVWIECGSACPAVCGETRPPFCVDLCVTGCQCPPQTWLDRSSRQCVTDCPATTPQIDNPMPKLCSLEPDRGLCRARVTRFFYNPASGQCETFIYGGCGGNENNFMAISDCRTKCSDTAATEAVTETVPHTRSPPTSSSDATMSTHTKPSTDSSSPTKPHGDVTTFFPPTGSDKNTRPTDGTGSTSPVPPFKPHGDVTTIRPLTDATSPYAPSRRPPTGSLPLTKPTENVLTGTTPSKMYPSTAETGTTPTLLDPCTLLRDRGPCTLWMRRYYYNAERNRCAVFRYGGCGGNLNNFESFDDCTSACM